MNRKKLVITTFAFVIFLLSLIAILFFLCLNFSFQRIIFFLLAGWTISLIAASIILISNRPYESKNSWLFVLLCLPHIGFILFIVLGVRPLQKLDYNDYFYNHGNNLDFKSNNEWYFSYALNTQKHPVCINNDYQVLIDNTDLFNKSIELIRSAKEFINLQSYIISEKGFWVRILFNELIKKAKQGVKIRIITDWVGIRKTISRKTWKSLKKYGIDFAIFNPKFIIKFNGNTNHRNHCKWLIIDNKAVLYGGSNFADEYISLAQNEGNWIDLNVILKGEIVTQFNNVFFNYWNNFCIHKTDKKFYRQNAMNDQETFLKNPLNENKCVSMQMITFDPFFNQLDLDCFFLDLIFNTKQSIKISTPYFCPTFNILNAIKMKALSGIKIELIIPSKNQRYIKMMNRNDLYKLVEFKNIKLYEFDGFLHSKYQIIDDKIVSFGSCNIDLRSIYLDSESLICIDEINFVNQVLSLHKKIINCSIQINQANAKKTLTFKNNTICKILNLARVVF